MSQPCSIGARPGEGLGQGNVLTLLACKKLMEESSGVRPSIVLLKDKTIVFAHERHHNRA